MTADGSELVNLNQLLELKNNLNTKVPSHKHAAGDITSGTLSLARGGTGTTTLVGKSGLIHNMFDTSGITNNVLISESDDDTLTISAIGGGGGVDTVTDEEFQEYMRY